jgi:DNA polymerase elongation subunit (family B)
MQDHVIAGDTDSIFIAAESFILNNIKDKDKWLNLDDENKVIVIQKLSESINKHVNNKMFQETQLKTYNSSVEDFKITYAIEKIAKSGLFIKKKKYALYNLVKDDIRVDEIAVTGLEIVRSETPVFFREALQSILEMILKDSSDTDIQQKVTEYKKKAMELPVEDISSNIGINQLSKYIDVNGNSLKGAP